MDVIYTAKGLYEITEQFLMDGLEDGHIIIEDGEIYSVKDLYYKAEQFLLDGLDDKEISVDYDTIQSLRGECISVEDLT